MWKAEVDFYRRKGAETVTAARKQLGLSRSPPPPTKPPVDAALAQVRLLFSPPCRHTLLTVSLVSSSPPETDRSAASSRRRTMSASHCYS